MTLAGRMISARTVRLRVQQQDQMLASEIVPAIQQLMHNDRITQAKIASLETQRDTWTCTTFRARLRWLFLGHP